MEMPTQCREDKFTVGKKPQSGHDVVTITNPSLDW